MARPVTTRKVKSSRDAPETASIALNAPQSVSAAAPRVGNAAFVLSSVLKTASELERGRIPFVRAQADRDVESGNINPNGNYTYRNRVEQTRARATWQRDEAAVRESLKDLDLTSISAAELNEHLDEQFGKYAGVDNPNILGVVVPGMRELRSKITAEVLEHQRVAEYNENGANVYEIARGQYEEGTFDYNDINTIIAGEPGAPGLFEGADRNKVFFQIISDLAIRNADPELLQNIPDEWPNGVKSIKNIPEYADQLRRAENQARAAREAEVKAAKAEQDLLEDEAMSQFTKELMGLTTSGDTAGAYKLLEVARREIPWMEGDDLVELFNSVSQMDNVIDEERRDNAAVSALTLAVNTGQATARDVFLAWQGGSFGEGKQAVAAMSSLMQLATRRTREMRETPEFQTADYRLHLGNIKNTYYAGDTVTGRDLDASMVQIQVRATTDYHELIKEGKSATQAAKEVYDIWDPIAERYKMSQTPIDQDPTVLLRDMIKGNVSAAAAERRGMTPDKLDQMVADGIITKDQAMAALEGVSRF